jgi:gliding motility-associated-like protein
VITYTGGDTESPTFTVPADDTICRDLNCTYNKDPLITGDVTDENDNCTSSLNATYSDDFSNLIDCDTAGYIIRQWTLVDDCGNSTNKNQIIWIEPTPKVLLVPQSDTICSGDLTSIEITSPSGPTHPVRFSYVVEPENPTEVNVTVNGSQTDLAEGYVIGDQLENQSDTAQLVRFIVSPYTVDDGGAARCTGANDTSYIWVEPVPTVNLVRQGTYDSVFCTGLSTDILITSVTQPTYDIHFRYSIEPISPTDVQFSYAGDTTELLKNTNLTDTIINTSSTVQGINVIVWPYLIDPTGTEKCPGISDTLYYEITPTLNIHDYAKTFVYDTLNLRCFKDNSGVIYLNSDGGITAYPSYDFYDLEYYFEGSPVAPNTDSVYNLAAGEYTLNVQDWSGCTADTTITLNQPDSLWSHLFVSEDIVCQGETAIFTIYPHGGTYYFNGSDSLGYDIVWTLVGIYSGPGDGTEGNPYPNPLVDASFGLYEWEVTDSNSCVSYGIDYFAPGNVNVFMEPKVTYGNGYGISCNGYDDGKLLVTTDYSGTESLDFRLYDENWVRVDSSLNNTAPYHIFEPLPGGEYILTLEDPNGCHDTSYAELLEPDKLLISDTTISQYHNSFEVSCFYASDGSISIDAVTGGHGNYMYEWKQDGQILTETSSAIDDLVPGYYFVKVYDPIGCFDTLSVEMSAPPEIFVEVDSANIDCYGESTGSIELTGTGGLAPLRYEWPDLGVNGAQLMNIPVGTYVYKVSDNANCYIQDSVTLTQSPELGINQMVSDYSGYEIACNSGDDGWIEITSFGGVGNHTYAWEKEGTPVGSDASRIENLEQGIYHLTVTDEKMCEFTTSFTLGEPDPLEFRAETTPKICEVYGTIESDVQGGVPLENNQYELYWENEGNPVGTGYNLADLLPGLYSVTITDKNDCKHYDSVIIEEELSLEVDIYIIDSVSCKGSTDATLGIESDHATYPLIYSWDNGPEGDFPTYNNVGAGIHTVEIVDQSECLSKDTITVPEPESIQSDLQVNHAQCYDSADASVVFHATGGNGGYTYLWNNQAVENEYINNLRAGTYEVSIIDRKECELVEDVEILQPDSITLVIPDGGLVQPDCEYSQDGEILVLGQGGTPPYAYYWPEIEENETDYVYGLNPGKYLVEVVDNNNCTTRKIITLESRLPACLDIPTAFSPNGDGLNDRWIIVNPSDPNIPVSVDYPDMVIEIYDRSGQKRWISEPGYTQNPETGWDGTDRNGNILPTDSYYYFVYLNNGTGLVLQDIITIIR